MDANERWLIEQARATLEAGTFSERDVLGLLILLRRHARSNSAVCEFGDFVAHREKDRGILHRYLGRIQTALKGKAVPNGQFAMRPVFTSDDIRDSFNELFTSLGFSPIDSELGNRLAVCVISLLQSVKVDTQLNTPALGFVVQMSSFKIVLIGLGELPAGHIVGFPMLVADNNGYEASLAMASPPVESLHGGDFLVEAYCQDGVFTVEQRGQVA
jgi:hypothetical protein